MRGWAALAMAAATLAAPAAATAAAAPYDFDGDGRQELAVGVAQWPTAQGSYGSGAVIVQHTGPGGLTDSADVITRPGETQGFTYFGQQLTSGDFDGDGFADLATISSANTTPDQVTVVYGSPDGLDETADGPENAPPALSVAAGDVNGDGFSDLAMGVLQGQEEMIVVARGGPEGLEDAPPAPVEAPLRSPRFADVNRDGHDDLIALDDASVAVCIGTAGGLDACDREQVPAYPNDVAAGNILGDRRKEVAVGSGEGAGAVHVYRTTATGLRYAFPVDQATRGVPGSEQRSDTFGTAVEVGQLGRGRYHDLAIGAPGEDRGRGRVTVVHGAKRALRRRGNFAISEASPGVPGAARRGEYFGAALALLDHDGDGRADLDIGAPGSSRFSGRTTVAYGPLSRRPREARTFDLETLGLPPLEQVGFGSVLGQR